MLKKRLDSYEGKLNNKQVADGINASRRNARRLVEDAQILLESDRYPTAASLAIFSIEESGKEHIIRGMAITETDDEVLQHWKDYRSHTKKNIMWVLPQLVMEGARHLDDFRSLFESTAEHPYILEQVKQIGFYTDCLGKANWSEPMEVIDKDLATMLVQTAKIFLKKGEITTNEIELWVKHLGPVKNGDFSQQKEALLHWYAEMQELGLATKGEKLTDFMQWLGIHLDK
ncbi:MAG TPA: AbiV family abortive infection protein [Dehalococcoidales bacterium]|nr:AbiV family abortive infection protein [Dehalococcoidales bacterium]